MMRLFVVQLSEPDESGQGVWQLRDEDGRIQGHLIGTAEAHQAIRDGVTLLVAATRSRLVVVGGEGDH